MMMILLSARVNADENDNNDDLNEEDDNELRYIMHMTS